MSNPSGFIPDGSGPEGERFGRDPATGRAFKRDGTVRKARTQKSEADIAADIREQRRNAQRAIGRKVMAEDETLSGAIGTYKAWEREAKRYGTPEAIERERESLQRKMDALEDRHAAAVEFLDGTEGLDVSEAERAIGKAYLAFDDENGRPPEADEVAAMLADALPDGTRERILSAADPANDPFAEFRRGASRDDSDADDADEADDTL